MPVKYDLWQLRGAYTAGFNKGVTEEREEYTFDQSQIVNPVGKWFHSLHDDGQINWQGQVLRRRDSNLYECQLYDWLMGAASDRVTCHASEMTGWRFYNTSKEMNAAWQLHVDEVYGKGSCDEFRAGTARG